MLYLAGLLWSIRGLDDLLRSAVSPTFVGYYSLGRSGRPTGAAGGKEREIMALWLPFICGMQ